MGVPKRSSSLNKQVDAFVKEHGGDKPIYRCDMLRRPFPALALVHSNTAMQCWADA